MTLKDRMPRPHEREAPPAPDEDESGLSTTPISLRPCRVHRRQEEFFSPCKLSLQVMEQRGPHHGTAFPRCSPKRPINVPADGSAYGSQTPGVVLRSSHSISAGAAWSANE